MVDVSTSFSLASPTSNDYWVRVEQIVAEETATMAEVADLLDELYETTPCYGDEGDTYEEETEDYVEEEEEPVDFTEEFFQETVKDIFPLPSCSTDDDGNWITQIKIIVSHPEENKDYTLRIVNGIEGATEVITEIIQDTILIENKSSILLDFPVLEETGEKPLFKWASSNVITDSGFVSAPEIERNGNVLSWGTSVTGSITFKYETTYNLVSITSFGDDGELGPCTAIAFYEKNVDSKILDQPKIDSEDSNSDYCGPWDTNLVVGPKEGPVPFWIKTRTEYKCQCSSKHAYNKYSPDPTQAQRDSGNWRFPARNKYVFGGYVNCNETTGDINKPEFYEENCCTPPPWPLPKCVTVKRKNTGGAGLDPEKAQKYIRKYGDDVRFVAVSPDNGDCGDTTWKQKINSINCCDEVSPLEWDVLYNPDVVPGLFHFTGGKGPYDIRLLGEGFSFHSDELITRIENYDGWFWVYLMPGACGSGQITVEDACAQGLTKGIKAPEGVWADLGGVSDLDGCSTREGCCAYPWGICTVGEPPETGQCYDYYSGGIGFRAEYLSDWEEESEGYKLVRVGCASFRNCVSQGCYSGACSKTEPISGIGYEAVIANPCIEGYGNTVGYILYEWSCDD